MKPPPSTLASSSPSLPYVHVTSTLGVHTRYRLKQPLFTIPSHFSSTSEHSPSCCITQEVTQLSSDLAEPAVIRTGLGMRLEAAAPHLSSQRANTRGDLARRWRMILSVLALVARRSETETIHRWKHRNKIGCFVGDEQAALSRYLLTNVPKRRWTLCIESSG
jgi:hypothetical protein